MRKTLIVTAAVLAAVIFFLLTLPSRPQIIPWPGDAGLAARTVAGAYHIHTTRSDGAGDRAAVAAAARRAGLKFIIITDHGDGTRVPDAPAYVDDVLCLDGVEISTNGGHYVALGIGPAPYPLGGEPRAVIEDVARLGGFGFAAHPDSAKTELSWTDWTVPFDGLEWLSADSEWRNESRLRLTRVFLDYSLRPGPALASILDRPVATLARWDGLTTKRPVLGIAGHDAHGGIQGVEDSTGARFRVAGIPSYEASFRSFSTRVVLDAPFSGDAGTDARALLQSVRAGRLFTAVDAIAGPAILDFHATRDGRDSFMGSVLPPGPASFSVVAAMPPGARTVLLRNGKEVSESSGGALRFEEAIARGAYRLEIQTPRAPGSPPVPWVVSNPIYFLESAAPVAPPPAAVVTPLSPLAPWHIEKDRASTGSVVASAEEVAFFYRLRGPGRSSQFAAAVADLHGSARGARMIAFSATAVRPVRVSVQLRYPERGDHRWARSVYLDDTPRDVVVPISEMLPADHQIGGIPDRGAASLLFVVDLTNALPGSANTIRLRNVGFAREP